MVDMSPSTSLVLKQHKDKQEAIALTLGTQVQDSDLVFTQPVGKPLLPNTITYAWIKLARRAGLKGVRLHDARHTHASLMLKQCVHPKIVQERLGHSSMY